MKGKFNNLMADPKLAKTRTLLQESRTSAKQLLDESRASAKVLLNESKHILHEKRDSAKVLLEDSKHLLAEKTAAVKKQLSKGSEGDLTWLAAEREGDGGAAAGIGVGLVQQGSLASSGCSGDLGGAVFQQQQQQHQAGIAATAAAAGGDTGASSPGTPVRSSRLSIDFLPEEHQEQHGSVVMPATSIPKAQGHDIVDTACPAPVPSVDGASIAAARSAAVPQRAPSPVEAAGAGEGGLGGSSSNLSSQWNVLDEAAQGAVAARKGVYVTLLAESVEVVGEKGTKVRGVWRGISTGSCSE
jgi:hypothetical protein